MPKEVRDLSDIEAKIQREVFGSETVYLSAAEHAGQDGGSVNLGWCINEGNGTYSQVPRYAAEIGAALKIMEAVGPKIILTYRGAGCWAAGHLPKADSLEVVTWSDAQESPAMAISMAALIYIEAGKR